MGPTLRKLWKRIGTCFLAGLFAILPLVITVGTVVWVTSFVERLIGPETFVGGRLRALGIRVAGDDAVYIAYVLGWVIVLLVIFGLGVLMELGLKRLFSQFLERLIRRIPLIRSVYSTSKQMIDMLDKEGPAADVRGMMSPVICHFGDDASPAVLALLASADSYVVGQQEYKIVIIPTAPVPFGGALLMMPSDKVKPLEMSVDGLVSIYASMGITGPQFLQVKKP